MTMRVFITGGAGFIGSHLVDHYLAEGHEVTILDNMSTGTAKNIDHVKKQIEIHQGDIRDSSLVDKLVSKSDQVLHMAAALGVNTILESTVESVSTNFNGSEVVINSALKHEKRILIASTSEVYGKNPKQPLSETDDRVVGAPQKIRWTYSDAKALEEAVAHSLFIEKGLQVTTVRFFNTVGPRQTGRYGMVIPRFVQSAIKNEALQIYGDGNQVTVNQVGASNVLNLGINRGTGNGTTGNTVNYSVSGNNALANINLNNSGAGTASGNDVEISQSGNNASARVTVTGDSNTIGVTTSGGSNNAFLTTVTGSQNNQAVSMTGAGGNSSTITQTGNQNVASVTTIGASNSATITQSDGGHTTSITATGSSNTFNDTIPN